MILRYNVWEFVKVKTWNSETFSLGIINNIRIYMVCVLTAYKSIVFCWVSHNHEMFKFIMLASVCGIIPCKFNRCIFHEMWCIKLVLQCTTILTCEHSGWQMRFQLVVDAVIETSQIFTCVYVHASVRACAIIISNYYTI